VREPTDAELDAYILTRLQLIGVDLGVLPADDASAPADQRRIMASVRRFLRGSAARLSRYELDPQQAPPGLYPAQYAAWIAGAQADE
jgi:hypothetical protein